VIYNFRTQQYDTGNYRDYFPQEPILLDIYDQLIADGYKPIDASILCLNITKVILKYVSVRA
jgi:hypothetical protein